MAANLAGGWRKLQKSLGLPITDGQLAQMRAHLDDIDFDEATRQETKVRHDVMARICIPLPSCGSVGQSRFLHLGRDVDGYRRQHRRAPGPRRLVDHRPQDG